MVAMTGAAAEGRQVSAALVIVSPDRGERPLAVAVLAAAPPGWLRPQVQPPRVGTGHQVIEPHSETIELWKRGSYVQVTLRAIGLIRRVEEAVPAGRQVVGKRLIRQAVAQACELSWQLSGAAGLARLLDLCRPGEGFRAFPAQIMEGVRVPEPKQPVRKLLQPVLHSHVC